MFVLQGDILDYVGEVLCFFEVEHLDFHHFRYDQTFSMWILKSEAQIEIHFEKGEMDHHKSKLALEEEEMVSNLERNNEIWSLFHLEKWHKKGNDYVFLLSQGGIQITFEDGGAIMFYRCNQTFSFLNPEKKLQTFNFSSISHHTNPEIANRLELAERLLLEFKVITIS